MGAINDGTGQSLTISVAGTHYGNWQLSIGMRLMQALFASRFIAAVGHKRIMQRYRFSNTPCTPGFFIAGCRRNKYVVPATASKEVDITLDVLHLKSEELTDNIEMLAAQNRISIGLT